MSSSSLGWLSDFGWERGRLVLRQTGVRLTLNEAVVAEFGQWLGYLALLGLVMAVNRIRARSPKLSIWFTPQRARPWYLARGAALWTGMRAARCEADADVAFYFEDTTSGAPPVSKLPMLNGGCANVSKSHVAAVFEREFVRPLRVDPTKAERAIVEKSEKNGVHDGRVLSSPCQPRPGYVYQRHIDTRDAAGLCHDLRTLCVGGRPVLVWEKEKAAGCGFSINNLRATLRRPGDCFAPAEQDAIGRFCARMGLDWGGLDILRDRNDGQIYVVDVNKTELGPVIALSWRDKIRSMRILGVALNALITERRRTGAEVALGADAALATAA